MRTVVSATSSRRAGVRRSRRGRSTGNGAPAIPVTVSAPRPLTHLGGIRVAFRDESRPETDPAQMGGRGEGPGDDVDDRAGVGRRGDVRDRQAASPGRVRGDGPDRHHDRRRVGPERLDPSGDRRPAGEHDGIDGAQPSGLLGGRPPADGPVGDDGLDEVSRRGQPVGQQPVAPGRPGPAGRAPGPRGNSPSRPSAWASAGTRSTGRPAAASSAAAGRRADGGQPQAGMPSRRATDAAGAVRRRHDEPVEGVEAGQRTAQGDTAVGRLADLDERHVDDGGPELGAAARRARPARAA